MPAIVLVHPEIPPNTGNVIRLAANTGAELHLVEPLGFTLGDRELKRAGLDYHEYARVLVHRDWAACRTALDAPRARRWLALTTQATRSLYACALRGMRSLNLSNAVAVTVYEAWRQAAFADSV